MTTTPAGSVPDSMPGPPPAVAALDRLARGDRAGAPAVVGMDGSATFGWLAAAAGRVAAEVRATHAEPGAHLGIVRRPTAGFVAAVLGCLQAGVAFSVIAPQPQVDPRYLGVTATLDPDDAPDDASSGIEASSPAPPVRHPAGDGDADWAVARFGLSAQDGIALWSGLPGQVVSTICTAVCAGAPLVVAPPVLADPAAIVERFGADGVTVLVTTAPILRVAAARAGEGAWRALRLVVVDHGGELLAADLAALHRVAPDAVVASTYRSDRSGVPLAVHVHGGPPTVACAALVPVGSPLPGSALSLRNAADRPAGIGEVGEVCAGPTRTGDLARRLPDGTLELVGKVGVERDLDRGATLAALRELPGVHDAVLVDDLDGDGAPLRIAYVAAAGVVVDPAQVRRSLATALPERLVPRHIVGLAVLPLTSAGLHDLDALPETDRDGVVVDHYVAPRTPLEHELCTMLRELLGVDRVGVDDSFFQLGGFSLLATQLTTRIRESQGVTLTLRDVFDAPTVDGLAQLIVLRQIESAGGDELEALLTEVEHAAADQN
jgi:hypothetical protein